MCVIIIKPAGHSLPAKKDLKAAYDHNPDGCGFASPSMSHHCLGFKEFWQHLRLVPKSEPCIIHLRWATHGTVKESNCHPFYDEGTHTWFAHNGILPFHPKGDVTDSEYAFRRILAPSLRRHHIYSSEFAEVVHRIIGGSRFAFLQDGSLRAFGQYYEYKGCYYSNLRHLSTRWWCKAS